jgi:hypothetical protein
MKKDNSHFDLKVKLRLDNLPAKNSLTVLDCFAGSGLIWNQIKKKTQKKLNIVSIDKKPAFLKGNNIKYLKSLNLNDYDIIDLDAYGIPFKQIEIILNSNFKGIIFVTFIQSVFGMLPKNMLLKIGYSEKMIDKIPTLFNRNGLNKLLIYLGLYGILYIQGYFLNNSLKNYFYIKKG